MALRDRGLLSDLLQRASLAHWARAARGAATADPALLRRQRAQARALRTRLDDLLAVAEARLALPRVGSENFARPPGTDWSWRPPLWREPLAGKGAAALGSPTPLGPGAAIFHDCRAPEIAVRQVRNRGERDLAPYGLGLEVFRFDGSFLSLVLELPAEAAAGLRRRHLVRLGASVEMEAPIGILARLNVKHGPNVEQIARTLPLAAPEPFVEFDLACTHLNEKRVERSWLDLIFEGPQMNRVVLRDVTLARYPRAEL